METKTFPLNSIPLTDGFIATEVRSEKHLVVVKVQKADYVDWLPFDTGKGTFISITPFRKVPDFDSLCVAIQEALNQKQVELTFETVNEIRFRITEGMRMWSQCDNDADYICIFCGVKPKRNDADINHKSDCAGKRLIETLNTAIAKSGGI